MFRLLTTGHCYPRSLLVFLFLSISHQVWALPVLDFESDLEDWSNTSSKLWLVHSGSTSSGSTGPSIAVGSNYAYMETSNGHAFTSGDQASLTSPIVTLDNSRVSFYYHMYGANIGTLELQVVQNGLATTVWQKSGQQQSSSSAYWRVADFSIAGFSGNAQLRFVGTAAGGYQGDMAIDQIELFYAQPPYNVQAKVVNSDSITVSWGAVSNSDCDGFVIYYENLDSGEDDEYSVGRSGCGGGGSSLTVNKLSEGRWQFNVAQLFQRDFCVPGDDCPSSEWESPTVSAGISNLGTSSILVYHYDALGRVTCVEDQKNGDRSYEYDAAGNRTYMGVGICAN